MDMAKAGPARPCAPFPQHVFTMPPIIFVAHTRIAERVAGDATLETLEAA